MTNEWVSVKDRLPEDFADVIVWLGGMLPSKTQVRFWHPKFKTWESAFGNSVPESGVTHWMPLPEPPKA